MRGVQTNHILKHSWACFQTQKELLEFFFEMDKDSFKVLHREYQEQIKQLGSLGLQSDVLHHANIANFV